MPRRSFTQRDAPESVRRVLSSVTPDHIRVRTELSEGWQATTHPPQVTVTEGGTPSSLRATSSENVMVSVYAEHKPEARKLASYLDSKLLQPGIVPGFLIKPGPGLLCVRDEDISGWLCSVTFVAVSTKEEF